MTRAFGSKRSTRQLVFLFGIAAILGKYERLRVQLADASLSHLANRDGIDTIFTLDRRHFDVLRLARGKKFRVIP